MAKSSINKFAAFILVAFLFTGALPALATKMARMALYDLKNHSSLVAVVEIQSTTISNKTQRLKHTLTPMPLISHQAKVVTPIKGTSPGKEMEFLNPKGLSAGKKYLVFLSKSAEGDLVTDLIGYGALRVSYIPTQSGIVESVRVPDSYIKLPGSLTTVKGKTAKDERATYLWVGIADLVKVLKK